MRLISLYKSWPLFYIFKVGFLTISFKAEDDLFIEKRPSIKMGIMVIRKAIINLVLILENIKLSFSFPGFIFLKMPEKIAVTV